MCGAVFLDNTVLAVGSGEEDPPDGKRVAVLPKAPESVPAIAAGPDGLLATGGADNVVRLFRRQD